MDTHRIDGIKFNFDRLADGELVGMRGHLLETCQRVTDEIGLIDRTLFERGQDELPGIIEYESYERILGRAVLDHEIEAAEAYSELGRYDG